MYSTTDFRRGLKIEIDGTPFEIVEFQHFKPGKGGAIKVMDGSVIAHPQVVKMLEDLAKKNKIGYQMDVLKFGGTDAGAVHVTKAGVPSSGVSISIRNCHRPQEVASIYDVEETAKLLAAFAGKKF